MQGFGRRALVCAAAVFCVTTAAAAAEGDEFRARLRGLREVPSVSSTGQGSFSALLDENAESLTYRLEYEGLEGSVTQAHIHFAQPGVNGGIVVFLCSSQGNGPAGTPECPESGSVEGVATAATMVNTAADQGLAAGEFAELVRAMRRGATYANVHSSKHPGGEIRGQIRNWD